MANHRKYYREVIPLTFVLRQEVISRFNAGQYAEALTFLERLITTGLSAFGTNSDVQMLPAPVPDAHMFALAVTIMIHPAFTTRAQSFDQHINARQAAMSLMKTANSILGPVNSGFTNALTFKSSADIRASVKSKRRQEFNANYDSDGTPDPFGDSDLTRSVFANKDSLFAQGSSFWEVIGWAFNCSVVNQRRWPYWKQWLDVFCTILEDDLHERSRIARTSLSPVEHEEGEWALQSLIMLYLQENPTGSELKGYIRAILANGSEKSINEFNEVWEHETKEPRKKDEDKRGKEVDIDNDEYGDFELDSSQLLQDHLFDDTPKIDYNGRQETELRESFGGPEARRLRWRLLSLMLEVASIVPRRFTSAERVLDDIVSDLRELPFGSFELLLTDAVLDYDLHIALLIDFLLALTSMSITRTDIFSFSNQLDYILLEQTANTTSPTDNAKISCILRNMLTIMHKAEKVNVSSELRSAVLKGRDARQLRVMKNKKRNQDTAAGIALRKSDQRLLAYLELLEASTGNGPSITFLQTDHSTLERATSASSALTSLHSSDNLSTNDESDDESDDLMID